MKRIASIAVFLAVVVGLEAWLALDDRTAFLAGAGAFAVGMVAAAIVMAPDSIRKPGGSR